jgi:hypothetical protein
MWLVACQPVSAHQEVRPMTIPPSPPPSVEPSLESLGGPWRSADEHGACAVVLTLRTGNQGGAIEPMGACTDAVLRSAREWRIKGVRIELMSSAGAVVAAYVMDGPDRMQRVAGMGAPALFRAPMH